MIGAIAGDIIGSVFEHSPHKSTEFRLFGNGCRFTDDTVMTVAVAESIMTGRPYAETFRRIGRRHPHAGYGGTFVRWLHSNTAEAYGSWGNGSAMRVSPVGIAFETVEDVLREAERSAAVTHDHSEGIKGAQAVALVVFLARTGAPKDAIRAEIASRFGYDLDATVDEIHPKYGFDVSCQGTVPQAIVSFLDSSSFESAVRNAVSLGGDSDTLGCIAGSMAEAYHRGLPPEIRERALGYVTEDLREIIDRFEVRYPWS